LFINNIGANTADEQRLNFINLSLYNINLNTFQ